MDEYLLHREYYKSVRGEDGEEHWKLWDPHHTQTLGPALTPAHLRTWLTLCLYPGDREGQYGDRSCQSLAGALKCAPLM